MFKFIVNLSMHYREADPINTRYIRRGLLLHSKPQNQIDTRASNYLNALLPFWDSLNYLIHERLVVKDNCTGCSLARWHMAQSYNLVEAWTHSIIRSWLDFHLKSRHFSINKSFAGTPCIFYFCSQDEWQSTKRKSCSLLFFQSQQNGSAFEVNKIHPDYLILGRELNLQWEINEGISTNWIETSNHKG
jgi:hypothetical protein